ncbi:MAG TPA: hypothetical protein VN841_29920 [Bryobacteraceae bacterium]|nr:hypothetical protein [Bryobacteraceae bacterium]
MRISIDLASGGVVAVGKILNDFIDRMGAVAQFPDFRTGFVDRKRDSTALLIKQKALVGQRVGFNPGPPGEVIHDLKVPIAEEAGGLLWRQLLLLQAALS